MTNIRPNALVLIKKDGYVLAQKGVDGDKTFYRLPGGGVEFGELSNMTIKRELLEELNAEIINEKFLCMVENIFEFQSQKYHEITFLYEGEFLDKSMYEKEKIQRIDFGSEHAEWISISEIKNGNIILYPEKVVDYI